MSASLLGTILLVLVFLVWAGLLWGAFSKIRVRAAQDGSFGAGLSGWWSDAAERKGRNTLLFITGCLGLMLLQQAWLGG